MVWQIVLLTLGVIAGVMWWLDRKEAHRQKNRELDINDRRVSVEDKLADAQLLTAEASKITAATARFIAEQNDRRADSARLTKSSGES